jgi:hypothetical protein
MASITFLNKNYFFLYFFACKKFILSNYCSNFISKLDSEYIVLKKCGNLALFLVLRKVVDMVDGPNKNTKH